MKRLPWLSLGLLLMCYSSFGWYLSGLENQPVWMRSACERVFAPIEYRVPKGQEPQATPLTPAVEPTPSVSKTRTPEPVSPAELLPTPTATGELQSPAPTEPLTGSTPPSPAAGQPETASNKPEIAESPANQTSNQVPASRRRVEPEKDRETICWIFVRYNLHVGLLAIAWIVLSSLAFISPLTSFSSFVTRWFKSDTIAFMTIVTIAGMAAVILYWLHVFLQILTILAADTLARIDIQTAGMSGVQAFWIMVLVSLTGLIAGWLFNIFVA